MWNPNVAYSGYHGQRDYRRTSYTPGNWMNRLVKETNVDSISASTSAPQSTTGRGNSRSRKTCVTTSVVGIAFILLLLGVSCVPLILYYVEKDQYKYYKADASITFQGTYNESLGDLSSQTSIDFQQDFCQVMEQTQANKFKETYSGCLVNKIKNGSIIVAFTMYYYAKLTVQTDEVKSEITIYLKTALTTFYSKFNITVDVNSLTVSLLQTGQNDYQSGTSDSRFQTSLLTSTTQGTTLLPTISSNADNSTSIEVTTIFTETTTTVPPETTTSDTPASTTVAPLQTSTTETPTTTTTAPPETTTTDTSTTTNTAPPETTTTVTPTTTNTAPPETTTTVTPTTTNTAPPETTTTDTPTTTTTAETTTTDTPTTTTTAETTTTDTSTTTSAAPLEATTTVTSTSTTAAPPETTTTDTSTTTTAAPLEEPPLIHQLQQLQLLLKPPPLLHQPQQPQLRLKPPPLIHQLQQLQLLLKPPPLIYRLQQPQLKPPPLLRQLQRKLYLIPPFLILQQLHFSILHLQITIQPQKQQQQQCLPNLLQHPLFNLLSPYTEHSICSTKQPMFHLQALMQRVTPQGTGPVTSFLLLLCGFKTFQGMILIV